MVVLETDRLRFRNHELADLESFCAMEADPEVRRYVGGLPRSREAAEEKFRRTYLKPIRNRLGMWATIYKPEEHYIGYCGVYRGHAVGEGTLGYYLAREYWGRGLATEAARAFVDFGFRELGLSRIVASVEGGNDVSKHILDKLGFRIVRHEPGDRRSFDHFALEKTP
jgi:RimJ/RimL family protein N-acetyltransferase